MPCPVKSLGNIWSYRTVRAVGAGSPVLRGRVGRVCTSDGVAELIVNCAIDEDGRGGVVVVTVDEGYDECY